MMQLRIGNRVIEVDTSSGVPTIHAQAEEIRYPDGRQDVIVHVPCMTLGSKVEGDK